MEDAIWLTWETQRRNRSTSAALGAKLFELDSEDNGARRYVKRTAETLAILRREQPKLLFAQNPSIILAALATTYGRLTGTPVIIDAHNAGLFPFEGAKPWANALSRRIVREADLTIVTNDALADEVEARGGRPFVLPDPLPELPRPVEAPQLAGSVNVLFVCTWAADEPYLEVIEAARRLPEDIHIYVTGRSKGRERAAGTLPPNVTLTGFVPEEQFTALLYGADIIVDLTTRENCLVCGAYEAVAAGKPLLLSNTRALRRQFGAGAVFTSNEAGAIAAQVEVMSKRLPALRTAVRSLKGSMTAQWHSAHQVLKLELARLVEEGPRVVY